MIFVWFYKGWAESVKSSYKIWLKHIVFFFDNAKESNSSQAELQLIYSENTMFFFALCVLLMK